MKTKLEILTSRDWLIVTDGTNKLVENKDYILTDKQWGYVLESNKDVVCYFLMFHSRPALHKLPCTIKTGDERETTLTIDNVPFSEGFIYFKELMKFGYSDYDNIEKRWNVITTDIVELTPLQKVMEAIGKLNSSDVCELQKWIDEYLEHLVTQHENNIM